MKVLCLVLLVAVAAQAENCQVCKSFLEACFIGIVGVGMILLEACFVGNL